MAVVALVSFYAAQHRTELRDKVCQDNNDPGAGLLGIWGFLAGAAVALMFLATTKTLSGDSYLYPLIPLSGKR